MRIVASETLISRSLCSLIVYLTNEYFEVASNLEHWRFSECLDS